MKTTGMTFMALVTGLMAGAGTVASEDYADQVARNPGVERLDARTVRKVVQRGIDVLGF